MKSITFLLILNFLYIENNLILPQNDESSQSRTNIIIEIAKNYLNQHISKRVSVLSIVLSSSTAEQNFFQAELVNELVNTKTHQFSYTILNTLDQLRKGNRISFNLVFIDGTNSLT